MSDTHDKRSMWQIMTNREEGDLTCELCLTTFSSAVSLECHTCDAVERQFPNGYRSAARTAPTPPATPAAAARDALVEAMEAIADRDENTGGPMCDWCGGKPYPGGGIGYKHKDWCAVEIARDALAKFSQEPAA